MPKSEVLKLVIEVDANSGVAALRQVAGAEDELSQSAERARRSFHLQSSASCALESSLASLKTLLVGVAGGVGLGLLAKDTIETAAGFEAMKVSLDTLTAGSGERWFRDLNEWALKMPVNTEKAIESFIMMRAMGLEPTIDQMTTLVDITSALGGKADTLQGIARALGQIQAKGKVSAEELMQLAERGVPAFQILSEKLGLTVDQITQVGELGINGAVAVEALLRGMAERFGGQAERMQTTWSGQVETLRGFFVEFQRLVMESGPMEKFKGWLADINSWLERMQTTGRLDQWAKSIGDAFVWLMSQAERLFHEIKPLWNWLFGTDEEAQGSGEIRILTGELAGLTLSVSGMREEASQSTTAIGFLIQAIKEVVSWMKQLGDWAYQAEQALEALAADIMSSVLGAIGAAQRAISSFFSGLWGKLVIDIEGHVNPTLPLGQAVEYAIGVLSRLNDASASVVVDLLSSKGIPVSQEITETAAMIASLRSQQTQLQGQYRRELMEGSWVWNEGYRQALLGQTYGARIDSITEQIRLLELSLAGSLRQGGASATGYPTTSRGASAEVYVSVGPVNINWAPAGNIRDQMVDLADRLDEEIALKIRSHRSRIPQAISETLR